MQVEHDGPAGTLAAGLQAGVLGQLCPIDQHGYLDGVPDCEPAHYLVVALLLDGDGLAGQLEIWTGRLVVSEADCLVVFVREVICG